MQNFRILSPHSSHSHFRTLNAVIVQELWHYAGVQAWLSHPGTSGIISKILLMLRWLYSSTSEKAVKVYSGELS